MIRQFIYFYNNLNIALMLDPGCEFFCDKCVQFPLMINLIKKQISKLMIFKFFKFLDF